MADVLGAAQAFLERAQTTLDNPNLGRFTIVSAFTPSFTVNPLEAPPPGEQGGFSLGDFVGKIVKPKVTIDGPFGPIVSAPYGEPPDFPWLGLVTAGLIIAGVVFLAIKLRNP